MLNKIDKLLTSNNFNEFFLPWPKANFLASNVFSLSPTVNSTPDKSRGIDFKRLSSSMKNFKKIKHSQSLLFSLSGLQHINSAIVCDLCLNEKKNRMLILLLSLSFQDHLFTPTQSDRSSAIQAIRFKFSMSFFTVHSYLWELWIDVVSILLVFGLIQRFFFFWFSVSLVSLAPIDFGGKKPFAFAHKLWHMVSRCLWPCNRWYGVQWIKMYTRAVAIQFEFLSNICLLLFAWCTHNI